MFFILLLGSVMFTLAQEVIDTSTVSTVPWYQNLDWLYDILKWVFGPAGLIILIRQWIPTNVPLPKWVRIFEYVGKVIVWAIENLLVKDRKKGGGTHNVVKLDKEVVKKEPKFK